MAGNTFSLNNISSQAPISKGLGWIAGCVPGEIQFEWHPPMGHLLWGEAVWIMASPAPQTKAAISTWLDVPFLPIITTPGAHQTDFSGGNGDAFLVKFNTNGVRQWGTYYGGSNNDQCYSCAVDGTGQVYIVGQTASLSNMTTPGGSSNQFWRGLYGDAFWQNSMPTGAAMEHLLWRQ
ncbi:MAG: SBBP repeat-containing protein [Saprospirales bacterium]|nr:SBBP repeat-containing protein [Saprospirales bacterium]